MGVIVRDPPRLTKKLTEFTSYISSTIIGSAVLMKSRKTNTLVGGLIERASTSSMADQIKENGDQKPCTKTMVTDGGKRIKTQNNVKPFKNTNKNPQTFLKRGLVQKGVPPSHKLQHHAYKQGIF